MGYGLENYEEDNEKTSPKSDKEVEIINFLIKDYDYNTDIQRVKITLEENNNGFLSLSDKDIKFSTDAKGLNKITLGNAIITSNENHRSEEIVEPNDQSNNKKVISDKDDKMIRIATQDDIIEYFLNNLKPPFIDKSVITADKMIGIAEQGDQLSNEKVTSDENRRIAEMTDFFLKYPQIINHAS